MPSLRVTTAWLMGQHAAGSDQRVSAIMCGNDVIALGVLLEAQKRGISIPKELSVVGFDNLEWAKEFSPALTTMSVPLAEMGTQAARVLLSRIQGGASDHAIELPLELVVRETTGPVRQ
jgi:LacI family transcriptional regulator